jgi:copper binding plastocyanin/azurin family protein
MKLSFALLTAIGVAGAAQFATAADIIGTVTLSGTPPAAIPIKPLNDDPVCGKLVGGKAMTTFYVVGDNKGLADTIVMLKGVPAKAADASAAPVVLDQKNCVYTPQIVAVQTGQKLVVKNSDPATVPMHNVRINPTAAANVDASNGKISMPQMSGGADLIYTFPAAENFLKFQCDVHQWMFAWVTIVDNPYFAVTDKDGKFTIKNVPAGKYKIVALHRKAAATGVEKEIEVKDSGATADFTLEAK